MDFFFLYDSHARANQHDRKSFHCFFFLFILQLTDTRPLNMIMKKENNAYDRTKNCTITFYLYGKICMKIKVKRKLHNGNSTGLQKRRGQC